MKTRATCGHVYKVQTTRFVQNENEQTEIYGEMICPLRLRYYSKLDAQHYEDKNNAWLCTKN